MAALSKLACSKLRNLYLSLQNPMSLTASEIEAVVHTLTLTHSQPQSGDPMNGFISPIIEAMKNHFSMNGLDWTASGVRWATFLLNICTNVISATTTTKTWVRALNIICICSIVASVVLEILATSKKWRTVKGAESEISNLIKSSIQSMIQEEALPDLGQLFSETTPSVRPKDPERKTKPNFPIKLIDCPLDKDAPPPPPSYSGATVTIVPSSDIVIGSTTIDVETQQIMATTPAKKIGDVLKTHVFKPSKTKTMPCAEKQAAHWYSIVKRVLSMVLVLVAFGFTKGDLTAMQAFITMDKFKDVIVKNYTSASDVIEWLATDVCGFQFTEKSDALEMLSAQITAADEFIATPMEDYGEFLNLVSDLSIHINKTTKLVQTAGSIQDTAIKNSVDILKMRQTTLVGRMDDILKTINMKTTRQEPVPILIFGKPGVGKTTFVNNILIPKLAKELGISPATYNVKFSGTDKYWPEYANQQFCVFDEAFALASDVTDPMIETFNTVCSKTPYNMQGAFNKYQMCNFKFVFVITNKQDCPKTTHMLTTEASCGFWHRFGAPIEIDVKPNFIGTGARGSHNFKQDWSHLLIEECSSTISMTSGKYTITSKTSIADKDLFKRCLDAYDQKFQEFNASRLAINTVKTDAEIAAEALAKTNAQATAAAAAANAQTAALNATDAQKQSEDTSAFAVNISGPTGSGKSYTARFIANRCARYKAMAVQEHHNSLNTPVRDAVQIANDLIPYREHDYNELYNSSPGGLIFNTNNLNLKTTWRWGMRSALNFMADVVQLMPYGAYIPTRHVEYGLHMHGADGFQEIGTVRRLGIPGNHVTDFGNVHVPSTEAVSFYQERRGFLRDSVTGREYDLNGAAELVWTKYCNFLEAHDTIIFNYGTAPAVIPDIDIYFKDMDLCKTTLSNAIYTCSALFAPNADRYVKIPNPRETFKGTVINENYFLIPDAADMEVETVVKTMISTLRHLGINAKVRVQIGEDLFIADGNIVYSTISNTQSTVRFTDTNAQIYVDDHCLVDISIEDAIHGYHNGFHGFSCLQLEYLLLHRHTIESTVPGVKTINTIRQREIQKEQAIVALEHKKEFGALMQNHPAFPYIVALTVVASSAVFIGLVALITRFCCNTEEQEINITAQQETFPDDNVEKAFEEHAKRRALDADQIKTLRKMRLAQERDLDQPIGDLEYESFSNLYNLKYSKESIDNLLPGVDVANHLMKKIHKNTVVCVAGKKDSTCHGLLLKDNLVLTVSHIGTINPRVVCDFGTTTRLWDCEVLATIPDRDLAVWKITDKQFQPAVSIIKYFPKTDIPLTTLAQLVVIANPSRNVACTLVPDPVTKYSDWEWEKGGYVANFHTSRGPVTANGFCGFSYLSYDSSTIYGIHVGSKAGNTYGLMTIVSQEIISALLGDQTPVQETIETDQIPTTHLQVLDVGDEEYAVLPCSYHDLWAPDEFSKHAIPDSETLMYVARVPYNSPYPRKQKLQRTAFPDFEDFPNDHAPAPFEAKPGMQLVNDVIGRPDIAMTQVAKFGGKAIHPNRDDIKLAARMVREYLVELMADDLPGGCFPTATMFEAINGFAIGHPLHGYVERINMHSGAGFYWKHKYHVGLKGAFFQQNTNGDYDFRPNEVARHLQENITLAELAMMEGIPPLLINEDCIKSELLPKKSVDIGKARLFSVADTVEVMLERKYFLYALALLNKYHNTSPIKIGANPARDFNIWVGQMRRFGNEMVVSDFERFDKNLIFEIILASCSILLNDPNMAYCFAKVVAHGFHHVHDLIYHRKKGQNSGSGITTALNSVSVAILVAYAYIKIYRRRTGRLPKKNVFLKVFCMIFGDDLDWINNPSFPLQEVMEIFAELGLTLKTEVLPINESKFLSRFFNFHDGTVYAALKHSSYTRHLYWTTNDIPEQRSVELSLILDEAAAHNKKHFNQMLCAIFEGLRCTNDVLTLSLMDWRCFSDRRAALRQLIYTDRCFTRDPLSNGGAFTLFPTVEQFNIYVKHRYTKADEVLQTPSKLPVLTVENKFPLAALTVSEYFKDTRKESKDMAAAPATTNPTLDRDATPSNVRAEIVAPATMAKASVQDAGSNVSDIPTGPAPPVAITNATDATAPMVIGNSMQAPSLLPAGGVMNNVYTAAYGSWYLVGQATIAVDAAHNTTVFTLPYGLSSLAGPSKAWVSLHKRYTGSIQFMIETVGSNALAGTIMVGWVPNLDTMDNVESIMRIGKWINMPMNETTTGLFIVPDVRKGDFYRETDMDTAKHGIACVIHVPLTNPFGTTGATVAINKYVRLGADFEAVYWDDIPAAVSTSYPVMRCIDLFGPGAIFLIDGFEKNKTYLGDIILPGATLNGLAADDAQTRGPGLWSTSSQADSLLKNKTIFVIGKDAPVAEFSAFQLTHSAGDDTSKVSATVKDAVMLGTSGGNIFNFNDTFPDILFETQEHSIYWDNNKYGYYFYFEHDIAANTGSDQNAGIKFAGTKFCTDPFLMVSTWAYPMGEALPADYLHVTVAKWPQPLAAALISTAQGRASVPPSLTSQKLVSSLINFSQGKTLEFDVLSEYGGAAVLTCRFDQINGIYCRMDTDRTRAYFYQNSTVDAMIITNIRVVDNSTIMRVSPTIFFNPRYSEVVSPVQTAQKKKVRVTIQQRFLDTNPFGAELVERPFQYTMEAEAAIIAASAAGSAFSAAAQAGGSIFTKKKDREFAKEMMEDQQAFAADMWAKQTKVETAWKTASMGYDWKKTQSGWAHQMDMAQAAFKHQNIHDVTMWGLGGISQAAGFAHANRMQSSAQSHATQMQQTDFENKQALQQQTIDARSSAAQAAFGMTNPAMQTVYPSTSTAGTQTVPTGAGGSSQIARQATASAVHPAYAPASHSRPSNYPT